MMTLSEGNEAPDFTLSDARGKSVTLSQLRGKTVVLYFYPKDDTPGCTTEACNFRDDYELYKKKKVVVLGVSADPVESHQKFSTKYTLPFPLLADVDKTVCIAYGVWGKKNMYGRLFSGIHRTTFVINPEGKILKIYKKVSPKEHSKEIIELFSSHVNTMSFTSHPSA